MYQILTSNTSFKESLFQNEMGFQLRPSAIRRVVAKTQEILSSVFQHYRGVQIHAYSKTRGPFFST